MELFIYVRKDEPAAAVKQVSGDPRAAFLAGGTTLIDLMKLNVQSPAQVVDINHLPLTKIEVTDNGVRIGALVSNSDLAYHETIRKRYPVLSEALLSGATPQTAQHGHGRRQPATAHALHLLPRYLLAVQQASARLGLLGAGRLQPQPRCSRHQRQVHRHAPFRHVRGPGRPRRGHPHPGARGKSAGPIVDFHVAYGEDPAREIGAEARRADHRGRIAEHRRFSAVRII